MKPIGGYFGLELLCGKMPYEMAVPVNFGRGGLELILRTRHYRKVWIPDYVCPAVPAFLDRIGVEHAAYEINAELEPVLIPSIMPDEAFLYVNYFGVKDAYCHVLEAAVDNLILDLTQAFYYVPTRADGFNSARKFFGVPDGGFAFGTGLSNLELPDSVSYDRFEALLRRVDGDVSGGYSIFQALDESFCEVGVARMSRLTRMLLSSIDVIGAASRRRSNFARLHSSLGNGNLLGLDLVPDSVPLVYPYLVQDGHLMRKRLIDAKVFCPTYWTGIAGPGPSAENLTNNLVCLPLDQRYVESDMDVILDELVRRTGR